MSNEKMNEEVLVVPGSRLQKAGEFLGFQPLTPTYRQAILDPGQFQFLPRHQCETDPTWKQLIPYVVLKCGAELFQYTRSAKGTEQRLHSLRSLGIGGHISRADAQGPADLYTNGMKRELNEEVEILSPYREQLLGFIYDGRTPVGSVHVGILHLLELEEPLAWPREAELDAAGFVPIEAIKIRANEFETWSQFALEVLGA